MTTGGAADIFFLLDSVRIIAANGLAYAKDPYDRDRYERLMDLSAAAYSALLEIPAGSAREQLLAELGHITTKVGADAAIFNERGEILLMERADGSGWCLPCGWVEPGESPAEAVVREVREETGLEVEPLRLVDVFTRKASLQNGPHSLISVSYLCAVRGGTLRLSPEGRALRYWAVDAVRGWHATHAEYARAALALWRVVNPPLVGQ